MFGVGTEGVSEIQGETENIELLELEIWKITSSGKFDKKMIWWKIYAALPWQILKQILNLRWTQELWENTYHNEVMNSGFFKSFSKSTICEQSVIEYMSQSYE